MVLFGVSAGLYTKESIDQWQSGEGYIFSALFSLTFLILAIATAAVMSWALPVVVEDDGITVPAIHTRGRIQVSWSDLVDVQLTKGHVRLRFTARNGRVMLFSVRKAECETESYQMMLDMIREQRPDLFETKTTELGTV